MLKTMESPLKSSFKKYSDKPTKAYVFNVGYKQIYHLVDFERTHSPWGIGVWHIKYK